jgi:uncharacterized protein
MPYSSRIEAGLRSICRRTAVKELETIPARTGKSVRLSAGRTIKIINTHGQQVVDTWAFSLANPLEHMSMEHTRARLQKVSPQVGDILYTNFRKPIFTLLEDTTSGVHDTLIAACDRYRYELLGVVGYHDNCTDNLASTLKQTGFDLQITPSPLNLFMNVRVAEDGTLKFVAPTSKPGQHVSLRAEMDTLVVFSACPQDIVPVNGDALTPRDVHFSIDD